MPAACRLKLSGYSPKNAARARSTRGNAAASTRSSAIGSWIVVVVWLAICALVHRPEMGDIRYFSPRYRRQYADHAGARAAPRAGLVRSSQLPDEPAVRGEHPLVAAGRPADRRADPRLQAVPRRPGAERWAVAIAPLLPYLLLLFSLALTARRLIDRSPIRSRSGGFLRRVDERHVHAGADRPSRLAACAARARAWRRSPTPSALRGGLVLGVTTALSLAIGLEMIIYLALAGAAMVLFWVADAGELSGCALMRCPWRRNRALRSWFSRPTTIAPPSATPCRRYGCRMRCSAAR